MIRSFLKFKLHVIILALLSAGTVVLIAFLGGQDMDIAMYAAELILVFDLMYLIGSFTTYRRRTKALFDAAENPTLSRKDLPEPVGGVEKGYCAVLDGLYDEVDAAIAKYERESKQDEEYYTLWVHQIKTPIAALRLIAGEIEDRETKDAVLQEIFSIERYTELALQYTRIRDIYGDIVIAPFDTLSAVKKCVKKLASQFIRMKTSVKIGELQETILSDEKWFSFMLDQILSNAIKYSKNGTVCISGKDKVVVVKDNGIGIEPRDLPRIFEKGYTGFNGRIDNRASGIGLYLTKKVADSLGVKILAESTVGEGTRITLVFPTEVE